MMYKKVQNEEQADNNDQRIDNVLEQLFGRSERKVVQTELVILSPMSQSACFANFFYENASNYYH